MTQTYPHSASLSNRQRTSIVGIADVLCPLWQSIDTINHIQELAWQMSFRDFALDLASIIEHLRRCKPPHGLSWLPDSFHPLLHRMLLYLMSNSCWHLASFLLNSCSSAGIAIMLDGRGLSDRELEAEILETYAANLRG